MLVSKPNSQPLNFKPFGQYFQLFQALVLLLLLSLPVASDTITAACDRAESAISDQQQELQQLRTLAESLQQLQVGQWPTLSDYQQLIYDKPFKGQLFEEFINCNNLSSAQQQQLLEANDQLKAIAVTRRQLRKHRNYLRNAADILFLASRQSAATTSTNDYQSLLLIAYQIDRQLPTDNIDALWRHIVQSQALDWHQALFGIDETIVVIHRLRVQAIQNSLLSKPSLFSLQLQETGDLLLIELRYLALHLLLCVGEQSQFNSLLSLIVTLSWQLIVALLLFYLTLQLSKRTIDYVVQLQRKNYRSELSSGLKKTVDLLLRFAKGNGHWLTHTLIVLLAYMLLPSRHWLNLFYLISLIYAAHNFLWILFEWSIDRLYDRARLAIALTIDEKVSRQANLLAKQLVTIIAAVILSETMFIDGLIANIVLCMSILLGWLLVYRAISEHKAVLHTLSEKRFSEKFCQRLKYCSDSWLAILLLPIFYFIIHYNEQILIWHRFLLRYEPYQQLSARILRIKLERAVEDDASEENDADENASQEIEANYERWFSANPPRSIDNLWIPAPQLEELTEHLTRWHKGNCDENTLILTGEQGSGKSILIQQLKNCWTECELKVHQLDKKLLSNEDVFTTIGELLGTPLSSISELVSFDQQMEPTIIIIDEMQHSFLAEVGNFDAIRSMLNCTNASLKNIFWLLVFNTHSWQYLNRALGRSGYYVTEKKLARLSQQDIRKLIMQRHKASRRKLSYDELLISATSRDMGSAMRAAETRLFHLLWEQCKGNPGIALALWRGCVKTREHHVVEVGVPERTSTDRFSEFGDEAIFVYAALIIHSELNSKDLLAVTNLPEAVVRRALKMGIDIGMLERQENSCYIVRNHWFHTLTGFLTRRNLLHG